MVAESLRVITQHTILQDTGGGAGSADPAIAGLIVGLKESLESVMLRSEVMDSEGNKQFSRLPDHLKLLLYHLGHVPGADEPTALSTNELHAIIVLFSLLPDWCRLLCCDAGTYPSTGTEHFGVA
jgi:hypothetical protein